MANLFSIDNGKITYNNISTKELKTKKKKQESIKDAKENYNIEKQEQKKIQNNLSKSFANQGVVVNTGSFSTKRALLPVQNQINTVKNKKFSVNNDSLTENINLEKKYQSILNTQAYKEQEEELTKQSNMVGYAKYNYDKARVDNKKINTFDKIGGSFINGIKNILPSNGGLIKNENGNYQYLPSYNEQEQQKIMNSYKSGIGRFYGNATHELGRIGSSTAINMVAPYVGSTMYYGKMFMDTTNNAASEGYDTGSATLYGLVNTGWEYAVGKLLGSATKGLTGGKSSGYEEFLEKSFNKLLGKPVLSKVLANAGSEATEEFVQEYLDNFDKLLFLEKNKNPKDYISILKDKDIFADAVYSAAVGGVTGGILGTLSAKDTNVDNQDIYKTFKEELEQTKQETTNSDTVKRINELINRIDSIENSDNNSIDSKKNLKNDISTVIDLVEEEKNTKLNTTNSSITSNQNTNIQNSIEEKNVLPKVKDLLEEYFSTTNDFSKAGFILKNGDMLDFSDGYIQKEHNDIESIVGNMDSYIKNGTIRIGDKSDAGVLEIGKEPTTNQLYKIEDYSKTIIGKPLTVELHKGNSNLTIQYDMDNTNPTKVRNDIKNYYQSNATPTRVNILYNSDFQENLSLGQQQERLINNWISNGLIDDRNDPKIKKWIEGYPSIFPDGKIISNQGNSSQIIQTSGNIPINQELLNKYKSTTEMFNDSINNYNGEVNVKDNLSELQNVSVEDMKIGEVKKIAKEIFQKYNKSNTFYNSGNKILVNKTGIDESITKIFESRQQRELLKEHLLVFSDLGDIIEHSKLVNQVPETKGREKYNSWNYYYDGLKIGNNSYNFEFEVVSMSNGENHYRVQKLEKISNKKAEVSTGSTNIGTLPVTETSAFSANNISQSDNNVKLSNINNIDMQNNQINTKKILNPNEISNLTKKDANTTPKLPNAKVETGKGESKFYENVTKKTKMLPDNVRGLLSTESDVQYYKEVTNKESLGKAYQRLNDGGQAETFRWFNQESKEVDSTDVAEGWILLKRYNDAKDYDSAIEVVKKLREMGTKAGQTVQAFNIMQRMTPEGMVKYAQSELSEAYDNMVKNKTKDWIDKHREDFDLKPNEVQFIIDTMKEVSKMNDGYDKRVKLAEIQKMMTDKLPPEKGAALKSWMRISMLFNPKTQVRNVAGNALIAPVNYFGDIFSSYADKVIAKKTGVRTTGNMNIKAMLEGMRKGAYEATNDYKKGINTKDMEGNRFEISDGKSFNDKTMMGKALNRTESLLNYVMDVGDRVFSEASFENSLQNQMILNNTTEITQEMIDIAHQEALSRTWNDNNDYTRFVLGARKGLNNLVGNSKLFGYGLGDVLIPFAKTPANLTKAIVDYSPAGLVNTITSGINLRRSLSNGQYTAKMQHEFVQNLGKATAGTMLYILGFALAKAGITSGDSDDDKDVANFLKNTLGINSYSIKIGNKSFTYDWAQPLAAPLSITANIVQQEKENATLYENITSSLNTAGNILLEQSFLDSLNTVLTNNEGIATGIQEAVLELPSRAIPTFAKQIADLVDGTQRQTFIKDQPLETAKNKILAKIPFASKKLSSSVDTLGRDVKKYGGKNNVFNVFLNPANVNTENISDSAKEIYRLYKSTGETNIMPRVAPYYINQDGEKIILNTKQREEYQKVSGNIIENNLKKLLNTSEYKNMNDDQKSEIVSNIINYSYNIAKKDILGLEISKTYQKAYDYSKIGSISDYYTFKANIDDTNKDTKKESITNYLINSNLNNKQLAFLYGNYYSSEEVLDCIVNADISMKEFIKYNSKDFSSDYYSNGKEVPNSRKKKVISYVNSLNLSVAQKALLIKMKYSSYKSYDKQISSYINSKNLTFLEKAAILKQAGFTSYDKQIIKYVNNLSKTKDEKAKILKELGFKIRNGRVYSK